VCSLTGPDQVDAALDVREPAGEEGPISDIRRSSAAAFVVAAAMASP
jgi:hypothetical protein